MTREFVTIKAEGKEWAQPMTTREDESSQYIQGATGGFVRIPRVCVTRTFRGLYIDLNKNPEILQELGLK